MTWDHREPISHGEDAGSSRRTILRTLGIGAASGPLAVAGLKALAGERPHQRLQDRTPQRNRKQRNKRQNNTNQNTSNNTTSGGGLGAVVPTQDCGARCQEQCQTQSQEPCKEQCQQNREAQGVRVKQQQQCDAAGC